jgi:hypothetical protein
MPEKHVTGGARTSTPAPQAATLPKELYRQLISWLFGASTWASSTTTFGPLQYLHFLQFIATGSGSEYRSAKAMRINADHLKH